MHTSALLVFLTVALAQVLRYVVLAGGAFVLAQRSECDFVRRRRIAKEPVGAAQAWREVRASTSSMLLFALVAVAVWAARRAGVAPAPAHGSAVAVVGWVVALLVGQDAYFYFTHRALHHPRLFRWAHAVHHRSLDPSPLAAFSFHPAEAIIEALFTFGAVLLAAPPTAALLAFQVVAFAINLYGHLGVEVLPEWVVRTRWFRLVNTTTHHHQHHQTMNFNFGLYFQHWDRLFGTNHPRYAQTFVANAQGKPTTAAGLPGGRADEVPSA